MAFILLLTLMLVGGVISTLEAQDVYEEIAQKIDHIYIHNLHEEDINKTQVVTLDTAQINKSTLQRMRREIETTTNRLAQNNGKDKEHRHKKQDDNGQERKDGNLGRKGNHTHQESEENKGGVKEDDEPDCDYDADVNFDLKYFGRDTLGEPVIKKRVYVTFPSTRVGEKIGLSLPYEKKGNVLRFPAGYKRPLARMRDYADNVHMMRGMVTKEIMKRINRTSIAQAVQNKIARKMIRKHQRAARRNRTQWSDAKKWGVGEEEQPIVQEKLDRFVDSKRKGNATLTRKERKQAIEEFFLIEALEGYKQKKKEGLLTEEQERAIRHNFVRYFKSKKEAKRLANEIAGDIDEMHENDKQMFKKALEEYYSRTDDRPTAVNSAQELEADKRKLAHAQRKKGEERKYAAQNATKISAENKRPSNSVGQRENIDDEYWLMNKLKERLMKRKNGEITIAEERQFNADLKEYLIKRKAAWNEAKRQKNTNNAVMNKQEWEIILDEAVFQDKLQEFGKMKRALNNEDEQLFYNAIVNYYEKKQMRAKAEGSNTTDNNQWYGTMEEFLYNRALQEYIARKRIGNLTKDEENNYLESIREFDRMREKRIQRNAEEMQAILRRSAAANANPAVRKMEYGNLKEEDLTKSTSSWINLGGGGGPTDILGEAYWNAKADYEKKKQLETSTMSREERAMLILAHKQVQDRLIEYWQATTSEPPWRRRRTTFGYLG
uniref:Trichohyalin-like n=1 Tax=Cacopsylla melanoneura TaxID=428564 RepID=A0A8D8RVZ9_9HEMI